MVEAGLRSYLTTHPEVSALVGTRVYPLALPQGVTLPAVTYQLIASVRQPAYDGIARLTQARFQIDCWAETYASLVQLARAVTGALDGYEGPLGDAVAHEVRIVSAVDGREPETALWRRTIDVTVWYSE